MKFKTVSIIISIVLLGIIGVLSYNLNNIKSELNTAQINNKAYQLELDTVKGKSYQYQLTIDQLEYFNDSITNKLKEAQKQLGIKPKEVIQYQYINTITTKTDTITFTDTIFKTDVAIDTVVGDEWYNVELGLKYPDSIVVEPTFNNETIVLISAQKETVNPPKKCWLLRLFQKKHTVVKVDVIENNPYSTIKEQRFIEIIK